VTSGLEKQEGHAHDALLAQTATTANHANMAVSMNGIATRSRFAFGGEPDCVPISGVRVLVIFEDVLERQLNKAVRAKNRQREQERDCSPDRKHPGPDRQVLNVVGSSYKDGREKQKETDAILQQSFEVLPLCIDTLNRFHETTLLEDSAIATPGVSVAEQSLNAVLSGAH
jgi:hypothetical protein